MAGSSPGSAYDGRDQRGSLRPTSVTKSASKGQMVSGDDRPIRPMVPPASAALAAMMMRGPVNALSPRLAASPGTGSTSSLRQISSADTAPRLAYSQSLSELPSNNSVDRPHLTAQQSARPTIPHHAASPRTELVCFGSVDLRQVLMFLIGLFMVCTLARPMEE